MPRDLSRAGRAFPRSAAGGLTAAAAAHDNLDAGPACAADRITSQTSPR